MLDKHTFVDLVNEGQFIGPLGNGEVNSPINLWGVKISNDNAVFLLIRNVLDTIEEMQVCGSRSTGTSINAEDR